MESIDIYELNEWMALWSIEGGFGDMKQDYRAGQICSTLANVNRGKNSKTYKPEDFSLRPKHTDSRKDNTAKILASFEMLEAMNPKKRKKK
jgi:hypothetical protein